MRFEAAGAHAVLTQQLDRRGEELKSQRALPLPRIRGEVLHELDVLLRRRVGVTELGFVDLQLPGIELDANAGKRGDVFQLDRSERGLQWSTARDEHDLANGTSAQRLERGGGDVCLGELVTIAQEHARDVERHVAGADDHHSLGVQLEARVAEVGVRVVPTDELGRGVRAGELLARNSQVTIGRAAHGVDDLVVMRRQLVRGGVGADVHVPEKSEPGKVRDLLEALRHALELLVIRRDARAHQPVGRGEPLDQIDLEER